MSSFLVEVSIHLYATEAGEFYLRLKIFKMRTEEVVLEEDGFENIGQVRNRIRELA